MGKAEFEGNLAKGLQAPSESALESEVEDEDTIHVDHPGRRSRGLYAGSKYFESTDSLGVVGEDVEEGNHDDYSAPILASDEVAKEPFGYELEPAVSPLYERGQSSHGEGNYHVKSGSASSLDRSRPSSRPGSIHGNVPGFSISNSTPLEDLEEYEPLFPEDGQATGVSRPLTAADKVKRPELKVYDDSIKNDKLANEPSRIESSPLLMFGRTALIVCTTPQLFPRLNVQKMWMTSQVLTENVRMKPLRKLLQENKRNLPKKSRRTLKAF